MLTNNLQSLKHSAFKLDDYQLKLVDRYMSTSFIGHVTYLIADGIEFDISPNEEYDYMCSDSPDINKSWIKKNKTKDSYYDPNLTYKLNNYTYRSDDFDKEQSSNNMLYSGCSFTFGIGVPYKSIWANMLNDSFGYDKFYNLGISGGSFESIIYDVYTYIEKFGPPKGIVILFPPPIRMMALQVDNKKLKILPFRVIHMKDKEEKKYYKENKDLFDYDLWTIKFYKMVRTLEMFLESLGVPFMWGCWDLYVNKMMNSATGLKNYIDIYGPDKDQIVSDMVDGKIDYSGYVNKYWENARDSHPSVHQHFIYYKVFEKAWNDKFGVEHRK